MNDDAAALGRVSRRAIVIGAPALLLGSRAFAQSPTEVGVLEAVRHQLDFATGFRVKFETGYWSIPRRASNADSERAIAEIPSRLAQLSARQETCLLLHFIDGSGRLKAWLFDQTGLLAQGTTDKPYSGLGHLQAALDVDSRTAIRAPQPRRAPPPPPFTQPTPIAGSPSEELERAAGQLFPGAVREVLARRRGRLLLLSAQDTGAAPLAALPLDTGTRIVDHWATLVLPDLWALLDPLRTFDVDRLNYGNGLVVGDPDLSADPVYRWNPLAAARAEAAEVAQMMGISDSSLFLGADATRSGVFAQFARADGPDLIYMATHGVANSTNPMDGSFLALTGGHLFGRDLRAPRFDHWYFRHPLVVLSACQSALGRTFQGGAYGMARAWIFAGAAQVVGSLWNVDDHATRLLMTSFTDKLTIGSTPEEALRSAQLLASRVYQDDPGAWASFSVMGTPATRRR